jgi:hypothetical protein
VLTKYVRLFALRRECGQAQVVRITLSLLLPRVCMWDQVAVPHCCALVPCDWRAQVVVCTTDETGPGLLAVGGRWCLERSTRPAVCCARIGVHRANSVRVGEGIKTRGASPRLDHSQCSMSPRQLWRRTRVRLSHDRARLVLNVMEADNGQPGMETRSVVCWSPLWSVQLPAVVGLDGISKVKVRLGA